MDRRIWWMAGAAVAIMAVGLCPVFRDQASSRSARAPSPAPAARHVLSPLVVTTSAETARTERVEFAVAELPAPATFDRDGDGLADAVDPQPDMPGADAHGTNAEWYNVVCSNLLTATEGPHGTVFSFKDGVSSNAVVFVEIVADKGPARISFAGNQAGKLGHPEVVALAGQPNLVPLQMGVTYTVTSSVPYSITMSDYMRFSSVPDNPAVRKLVWPLEFEWVSDASGRRTCRVKGPRDPQGTFRIQSCPCRPRPRPRRRLSRKWDAWGETDAERDAFSKNARYPLLMQSAEIWKRDDVGDDRLLLFERGVRLGAGLGCRKNPPAALKDMEAASRLGYAPAALVCALATEIAPGWLVAGGEGSNVVTAASRLHAYIGTSDIGGWYDKGRDLPFVCGRKPNLSDDEFVERVRSMYARAAELGAEVARDELRRFEATVASQRSRVEEHRRRREEAERRKRLREERTSQAKTARLPLSYAREESVSFLGYRLGTAYPPPKSGCVVYYGDEVERYTPQEVVKEKFHGMDRLFMELTPTSHRLFSIAMRQDDFPDRRALMKEGLAVLDDLGGIWGVKFPAFRFEAPDWPHWPSRRGAWGGPIPELYVADENQWATSKIVFAFSHVKLGDATVKVRLGVVNHDEFSLSLTIRDEKLADLSKQEFDTSFRARHGGMDFYEWSRDRQFRSTPEYKLNETRRASTNAWTLAGWTLGSEVDTNLCSRIALPWYSFAPSTFMPLKTPFLDIYSHASVDVAGSNRVGGVTLKTEGWTKDIGRALENFRRTKAFLAKNGMDDYHVERQATEREIMDFLRQNPSAWETEALCSLSWVDKTRTILIDLRMMVKMQVGIYLELRVAEVKPDDYVNELWKKCLNVSGKGKAEAPASATGLLIRP